MELEDETEMLVAEIAQFLGAEAAHIHTIHLYAAAIWLVEGTDNLEKGSLSGTTRTDDTDYFALVNMQVDALEYLQRVRQRRLRMKLLQMEKKLHLLPIEMRRRPM